MAAEVLLEQRRRAAADLVDVVDLPRRAVQHRDGAAGRGGRGDRSSNAGRTPGRRPVSLTLKPIPSMKNRSARLQVGRAEDDVPELAGPNGLSGKRPIAKSSRTLHLRQGDWRTAQMPPPVDEARSDRDNDTEVGTGIERNQLAGCPLEVDTELRQAAADPRESCPRRLLGSPARRTNRHRRGGRVAYTHITSSLDT